MAWMPEGAGAPPELGSTLNVGWRVTRCVFELHITNVTASRWTLEFATAQRYDFEVADAVGERLWRWSDDMMFAQALGRKVLAPGESRAVRRRGGGRPWGESWRRAGWCRRTIRSSCARWWSCRPSEADSL
jgi:hypothetical protein